MLDSRRPSAAPAPAATPRPPAPRADRRARRAGPSCIVAGRAVVAAREAAGRSRGPHRGRRPRGWGVSPRRARRARHRTPGRGSPAPAAAGPRSRTGTRRCPTSRIVSARTGSDTAARIGSSHARKMSASSSAARGIGVRSGAHRGDQRGEEAALGVVGRQRVLQVGAGGSDGVGRVGHVGRDPVPDGREQAEVERGLRREVVQQATFGHPGGGRDRFQGHRAGAAPGEQVAQGDENPVAGIGRHVCILYRPDGKAPETGRRPPARSVSVRPPSGRAE